MTEEIKPYFTSKSGKKLSIQHGSCWYQEHDTTQFNILKVLVDSIPKGQSGYVIHKNALRTVKRFMKTARFGHAAQIEHRTARGNEYTTYILNKYQFLVIAAALSDKYLQLAVSVQHANLSAEELAMDATDFMQMIKKQADDLMEEAVQNETASQTQTRMNALFQLDDYITEFVAAEAEFVDTVDPKLMIELAKTQVDTFQPGNVEYALPQEWVELGQERLEAAIKVRDAISTLLQRGKIELLPDQTVQQTISHLRDLVVTTNGALKTISAFAGVCTTPEQMAKCSAADNSPIIDDIYLLGLKLEVNKQMVYQLKRNGIDPTGGKIKNFCRDDLLEFGIYATMYDRMAMMDHYYALCNEYKAKYNYTNKQISHIFTVMEGSLQIPECPQSLVLAYKQDSIHWVIYTVHR